MDKRDICIFLNLVSGIGYSKFNSLLQKAGNIENIFSLSYESLTSISGINKILANKLLEYKENNKLEKEKSLIDKANVNVVTILDDEYPEQLKQIPDPPLCLYIKGHLECDFNKTMGVIGTRRITHYGREMTEYLVSGLTHSGFTIVSGLAYGVDAVAHKTTVDNNGITIAVLGGGLARLHPQDHLQLARSIVDKGGAVISEFPMEFPPNRKTFPMRNRIISGLSYGVLVTEAGVQSGSLITANFAIEHGRTVYAVPGNANSPMSKGCNKLIREGAVLTENIDDIVEDMELLPGLSDFMKQDTQKQTQPSINFDDFSEVEQNIIKDLKHEDKSVDQLSMSTQLPLGQLLVSLQNLELKKIILQLPGKRYKLKTK